MKQKKQINQAVFVLGISCFYHDSAACILKDGKIIAAAEEERFSRIKHDNTFPEKAVKFCLEHAKINIEDVQIVSFYEKPLVKFERVVSSFVRTYPLSYHLFAKSIPSWVNEKLRIRRIIRKKTGYKGEIFFTPHHLSHAAAAYYASPFKISAILTIDGVGETETASLSIAQNGKIKPLKSIRFPDSLGLFYTAVTTFLGFEANNDEYKVMGLASYGKPAYYELMKQNIIQLFEDGSFKLNSSFFCFEKREKMFSGKIEKLLGSARKQDEKITIRHKDIAASAQKILEEAVILMAKHAHEITKTANLCLGGGVALNCVANGKLEGRTPFKNIFIFPSPGDSGGAVGSALLTYFNEYKKTSKQDNLVYLGPEFSDTDIEECLKKNNLKYKTLSSEDILIQTSNILAKGKVVGWFQGRMEFGPRALGNRSILADPTNKNMQDILNKKVKHRESFRPFAPVVIEEKAGVYFETDKPMPYMLQTKKVRDEFAGKLPAITHIDKTARVQTVSREQNDLLYDLLKRFEEKKGVPVLVNTSFNVRGEPIVCTPTDAVKCFLSTEIDALVIGHYLVLKK